MNKRERKALKYARSHGSSFAVRTERMIQSVERTTMHVKVNINPVILNRYNDGKTEYQPWTIAYRIVKRPAAVPGNGLKFQKPGTYRK